MPLCVHNLSMSMVWDCIYCYYICGKLKYLLWSRVWVYYRADKKYKKFLGKLCFKGHLQANIFLVELIFILLSLINQADSLITCELDYMLLF